MPESPAHPQSTGCRAIAFVDGQNLFRSAKEAFGYTWPNYDVGRLAAAICEREGWILAETRFYTGVPELADDPFWHNFWAAKLRHMGRTMTVVFRRPLRYSSIEVVLPDGNTKVIRKAREKGIDVRIALDMVRAARERRGNVLLVFSQDQDLTEAVEEVKLISRASKANIRVACAYPVGLTSKNTRGIEKTDWIMIDKTMYDACIDPNDYRTRQGPPPPLR